MRRALIAFAALPLLFPLCAPAAAQEAAYLHIVTYVCETDHEFIGGGFGEMPEDCHYQGGISIQATDQTGTMVAECTTVIGGCSLELPFSTTITVTEDVSTVPAGYAPPRNPIVVDSPPAPGPAGAFSGGDWIKEFINVATVNLPATGAGSVASADQQRGMLPTAIVALLLSVVAYALRRRSVRSGHSAC
jgi:hypothetical protein